MNKFIVYFITALVLSCSKTDRVAPSQPSAPLVTASGAPDGVAITKTIGADGGTITSSDGNISITIPAGALKEDQSISVQPITNQLPMGYGKAYRLTPHDISFHQPVTINFRYNEDSIKNSVPELLGIAYQDQEGKWFFAGEPVHDKTNHLLKTTTTHFSDWGFLPYFYIDPSETLVDPGTQHTLKVMATVPGEYMDFPSVDGSPVVQSYAPPAQYIGAWNYAGEGSLDDDGNKASYQAPAAIPRINPEAVSVAIKMKQKGQFLLVSNITIRSELHIDYMQVDETETHTGWHDFESRLWLYGSFGEDPGANNRSVKIAGTPVKVAMWTPEKIACDIPATGPGSDGMVEVMSGGKTTSKLLNFWLVTLHYEKVESPDGALTKRIDFILALRGDGEGLLSNGLKPMVDETDLNKSSLAVIDMPSGSYTSRTTMDGCGDYTVTWDAIHDLKIWRTGYTEPGDFNGRVVPQLTGFDVQLRFIAKNALTSHRQFVACRTGSTSDDVSEDIPLQVFQETTIPLRFERSGDKVIIKPGEIPMKTSTGPAAGLYFDASDYVPDNFTTHMYWNEARPGIIAGH